MIFDRNEKKQVVALLGAGSFIVFNRYSLVKSNLLINAKRIFNIRIIRDFFVPSRAY